MLKSKISIATHSMASAKLSMQPAAAGLDKVVARSLRKVPADQAPLLAWPLACGSAVAARTRALDVTNGILRVEVPDAGWCKELRTLARRYIATINRYLPDSVSRVEFIVAERKPANSTPADHRPRAKRA